MRRHVRAGLALLAIALGCMAAFLVYREWRLNFLLNEARAAVASGDRETASRFFVRILDWSPHHDEAAYELGLCEEAGGRIAAAVRAWERIESDSPYGNFAALRIAPIALEWGRFADAEVLLRRALSIRGTERTQAREFLGRVLRFENRRNEARELLRQELRDAPDPVRVLRLLWMLDAEAVAVERTLIMFEKAARDAPGDDRVVLGLANLARRSGRLDEAEERLRSCLKTRPEDPIVWRCWLEWALASERIDEVHRALTHIPVSHFGEAELAGLRVWLAAHADDPHGEWVELQRLIERDPAYPGALERLIALEALKGRTDRVGDLRQKKEGLDRARKRYDELFGQSDGQLSTAAREMAGLADILGRSIEARGWWSLQLRAEPRNEEARSALARLDRAGHPNLGKGTAAEFVADLVASRPQPGTRKGRDPGEVGARPAFTDDASRAGLVFTFDHDPTPECRLPETMSGGVGLLDYDGDGWLDVYCVQGGPFGREVGPPSTGDRLFRNRGDGTFEDASEPSGISAMPRGYGHGVAVGDYDNDGRSDLLITRLGSYALYRNRGDGTFQDRTESAGLGGERGWPTSAAFADLDGDGDLDLYVCHYVRWSLDQPARCRDPETNRPTYCEPRVFQAGADRLFRNDGGHFVDVSAEAGIMDREGRGLGIVATDLNGDGRVDLFVANDTTANYAFINEGGMRFRESGVEAGLAGNALGSYLAGMGVACGDPDGDGRPDLAVTNFYDEATTLYRNLGRGLFADDSTAGGTALPSRYLLGFGISFLDFNNDGQLDLVTANGHVNDSRPLFPYAMPAQLLAGNRSGRFVDVTARAGPPMTSPRIGRGLAVGDLDNDGRTDVVIVSQGEPLAYLHNQTPGGHFLVLRLEGTTSARDAIGARVVLNSGGRLQYAWRFGGGSYLSASDTRLHFGIGERSVVESVEVFWPSGQTDRFDGLQADQGYLLREGQPTAQGLAGFGASGRKRTQERVAK